eukprot:2580445-Pleurochrysis_carterae.AAC.2
MGTGVVGKERGAVEGGEGRDYKVEERGGARRGAAGFPAARTHARARTREVEVCDEEVVEVLVVVHFGDAQHAALEKGVRPVEE